MDSIKELRNALVRELDAIAIKGDLTPCDIHDIHIIADTIKDIDCIDSHL